MRQATLLGALVALTWAVAPAFSMRPYVPEAVDFEQPLPALERVDERLGRGIPDEAREAHADHPGEGPVTFRGAPIEAPHRFDLVGIAGEMRPVELRVREHGGPWSEWVEISNGDPLYGGGSDEVQVRARGWRPQGRLHFVNVSGTTSTASSLLNEARGAVNSAFITTGSALLAKADAAVAKPDIISRSEWGANRKKGGCKPRSGPAYGKVKAAAIHHTVSANGYSRAQAAGIVLGICRYHRNGNGWNDIGYNALVDRFGRIYAGRKGGLRKPVVGAHAQGVNAQTTGVAALGDHSEVRIGKRQMGGFARFLAWKLEAHRRPPDGRPRLTSAGGSASRYSAGESFRVKRLFGHRRVNYTACPGDGLRKQLEQMRTRVARKMG